MIVRISHRITPDGNAADYETHLRTEELPARKTAPGNLGTYLLRRTEVGNAHFVLLTLWESPESVSGFLAREAARAHDGPPTGADLAEREPLVGEFELMSPTGDPEKPGAVAGSAARALAGALTDACAGWRPDRSSRPSAFCGTGAADDSSAGSGRLHRRGRDADR